MWPIDYSRTVIDDTDRKDNIMAQYRDHLLQLEATDFFLTDGGMETSLIFNDGIDLPHFASYVLLETTEGRAAIADYFTPYLASAAEHGAGFVLETATWRANSDWGTVLGHDASALDHLNRVAVDELVALRSQAASDKPIVISGVIGPRGDGYDPGEIMSTAEAETYHSAQIGTFSETEADLVTAFTITNVEEATGIVLAAVAARMPVVVGLTVETDGRLPDGTPLAEAIERIDAATGGAVEYFMINCAHPTHFAGVLEVGGEWVSRIGAVRANASTASHAELDEATELDDGDPVDLGERYLELQRLLPNLRVMGGCCGTDHRHIDAIGTAVTGRGSRAPEPVG